MSGDPKTAIRLISIQLRSIAYLIENHSDEVGSPLDLEEIHYGIGLLLTELGQKLKTIANEIDRKEVGKFQRKKSCTSTLKASDRRKSVYRLKL